jgi:ATP-binding cassette subfamily B protein
MARQWAEEAKKSRGMRSSARLVGQSVRLVWAAGPRELLVVLAMQLIQAVGVFVLIIQIQQALTKLIVKGGPDNSSGLVLNLVLFLVANVVIGLAGAVINNRRQLIGERTTLHICMEILRVVCLAELDDFDDSRFHDRLQRAAISAVGRPMRLVQSLISIGQSLVALGSIWLAMLILQPWIALVILLVVIPIWIGGTRGGEQYFTFVMRTAAGDRNRNYLFHLLTDRAPAKEIRAFSLSEHLATQWRQSTLRRLELLRSMMRKRLRASTISSLGSSAVLALAAGGLVAMNRAGYLTLADTATIAGAMLLFGQRLLNGIVDSNDFFESAPLVRDLNAFLDLEPNLSHNRTGARFAGDFERIELDDVTFTYRDTDRPAVHHLSMEIRAGEVVALVGENGSGKTTLAKLLAGLYFPQQGAVRVDGVDLADMDIDSWRAASAVLFQDFVRYALPAAQNISLGSVDREPTLENIRAAAAAGGADEFVSALREGYDTILSPEFGQGVDLSLGQWQRIALARAFFRGAPLVILDEPSASLDARAERALFESVRDLYADRTVLLVSHRFSTVRTADRIIVLSDGKIVEQGSHAELMAADGLYAELFTIQASGFLEEDIEEPVNS